MPSVNYFAAACLAAGLISPTYAVELNGQLEITGRIEVEATYAAPDNAPNATDLTVATGELGIHGHINDWTSGHLIILFEDGGKGDDTFEVDNAIIHFAEPAASPYFINIGRLYVPFGRYDTAFVQDPLTQDMAETRATALAAGWEQDNLHASAWLFNGRMDNADDHIGHYGLRLGAQHTWNHTELRVGLSYTNSIAESGGLSGNADTARKVAGFGMDIHAQLDSVALHGEYIAAQDDLKGADSQASTYQIEISRNLPFGETDGVIGLTWQGTKEASAFDLPKRRIDAVISADLMDQVGLAFEVGNEKDYAGASTQYAVAQLGVTF